MSYKPETSEERRAFDAALTLVIEGLGLAPYDDGNRYITFGNSGLRRFEHDLRVVVREERREQKRLEREQAIERIQAAKAEAKEPA